MGLHKGISVVPGTKLVNGNSHHHHHRSQEVTSVTLLHSQNFANYEVLCI